MIDYKHAIHFDGIEIRIPRELAEGGDDEAIKDYIRENIKSHVHCQQLADKLLVEYEMGEQLHLIGKSRQEWVGIRADMNALTRVRGMPEIEIVAKDPEEAERLIQKAKTRLN